MNNRNGWYVLLLLSLMLVGCGQQGASDAGPPAAVPGGGNIAAKAMHIVFQQQNARLNWSAEAGAAYYLLDISGDNGFYDQQRLAGDQISYTDPMLIKGVLYNYQLSAYDAADHVLSRYEASARLRDYTNIVSDAVL